MNHNDMRTTMRAATVALFIALPAAVEAQGEIHVTCGPNGKATFTVARVAGGPTSPGTTMTGSPGSMATLERKIAALCAPPAPEFITEDSKQLLSKIKLAKAQSDTSKKLTNAFAARTNSLGAQRMKALNEEREKNPVDSKPVSKDEARRLYLTPEIQRLREQYALSLRVLLTPEQATQFETNLAALKAKDEKISG